VRATIDRAPILTDIGTVQRIARTHRIPSGAARAGQGVANAPHDFLKELLRIDQ